MVSTDAANVNRVYGEPIADRMEGAIAMSIDGAYANPASLVSTDWVAEHLEDPKVRLLEVDVDTTAYERGHILGAVGSTGPLSLAIPFDVIFRAELRSSG